jgi:plasmid stabilization system protein ParE
MRNSSAVSRFDDELRRVFARIRENPNQFPEYGLLAVQNGQPFFYAVRRVILVKFPYSVFFYVRQGTAIVLAVAHAKRRPGYWTGRH